MDVDAEGADRTVLPEPRVRRVLWLGRCNLAVLVLYTVALTVIGVALEPGFVVVALLPIGLCIVHARLLRGVGAGSATAWWGLVVFVLLQAVATGLVQAGAGMVDPRLTTWLVLQVLLLGLLVL